MRVLDSLSVAVAESHHHAIVTLPVAEADACPIRDRQRLAAVQGALHAQFQRECVAAQSDHVQLIGLAAKVCIAHAGAAVSRKVVAEFHPSAHGQGVPVHGG